MRVAVQARRGLLHPKLGLPRRGLSSAAAEPTYEGLERFWIVRNPITTFFFASVGTWAYTLYVANQTRKQRDEAEDKAKALLPATADELLELRALNDIPTSALLALPETAARVGRPERIERPRLLGLLRRSAGDGQPLKEEYVLERLLMALPDASATERSVDVRLASAVLSFLSSGSVHERMDAMYRILGSEPSTASGSLGFWGSTAHESDIATPEPPSSIDPSTVTALLSALMVTGQVPPEKMVVTEDKGKYSLGPLSFAKSWFEIEISREYPAQEMVYDLLLQTAAASAQPSPSDATSPVAAAAFSGTTSDERVDMKRFIAIMESQTACVWGECYQIAERAARLKAALEAEEYARSPPFYARWWKMITGGGSGEAASNAEGEASRG